MGIRGRLIGMLWLALALAPAAAEAEDIILNLKEADLQALISMVSEETGTNFVVDPRVRGRVTVVSGSPVSRDELYRIFLSVLRIHGFSAVPGDGVTKLVPDALAKQAEVPTMAEPARRTDEYITRVIRVEHVDAAQLVPILRPLVPQSGHLVASAESNVLIVSDTAANAERIADLVARIDLDGREEMELIPLHHASASEVVRVLTALHSGEEAGRMRVHMVADERTNSILLGGDPKRRVAMRAMISHLDTRIDGGHTQVIYLRYAKASELAEVLRGMLEGMDVPAAQEGRTGMRGGVSIHFHEATNALVLNGPPDVVRSLRAVIQQLDVRRAQVLVEAVIAEVSSERAAELGIQWGIGNSNRGVGLVNFDRTQSGIVRLAAGIDAFLSGSVAQPPSLGDGAFVGGIGRSGSTHIAALVRALAGDTSSNILSTPSLMTMDNEEAEIIVGQNVPFIAGRSIEQSGQAFDTIQREDVGVKLRIRPQINEGNAIRLEIEQEVSQIAPGATGAADLVTNKRSLRTIVMVEDGQMVVLGGLIDDVLVQTQDKVPGLGDIPALGRLFRYDTARMEKRNLMVFLNPVIVRDAAVQGDLSASKYSYIRAQQLASRERGVLLLPDDTVPVLPPWEELLDLPPPFEAAHAVQRIDHPSALEVRSPPARP